MTYPINLRPLGYQQITDVSAAIGLTAPAGTAFAMITAGTSAVRWRDDGTDPTAGVGYPLPVNSELTYAGSFSALKFIQQAAGAVLDIVYYGA
jgi:hypothetical protein